MTKAFSNSFPESFTLEKKDSKNHVIVFNTNVSQIDEFEANAAGAYVYDTYSLEIKNRENLYEYVDDNYDYLLKIAQNTDKSCESKKIRQTRDKLLQASDAHVLLDRLGLEIPSGDTFTAWKPFLNELASAVSGSWAEYRQALRDIPQQEGFPYNVKWPVKPAE